MKNCKECKFYDYKASCSICRKNNKLISINYLSEIPRWCPLIIKVVPKIKHKMKDDKPIEELFYGNKLNRVFLVLKRNNINMLSELLEYDKKTLLKRRGIGIYVINYIEEVISKLGYKLGDRK